MRKIPKGPTRQWRKRLEPILDDEIRASVAMGQHLIHSPGEHDLERGGYAFLYHDGKPFFPDGCKTQAEAFEIKKALKRSGTHLGFAVNAWPEKKITGGWRVKYRACCTDCARAWTITTHGEDRSKWPYDPRRPRNETDHV